jgi:hypothetical protein
MRLNLCRLVSKLAILVFCITCFPCLDATLSGFNLSSLEGILKENIEARDAQAESETS